MHTRNAQKADDDVDDI